MTAAAPGAMLRLRLAAGLAALVALLLPRPARACDTVELWPEGASEVNAYLEVTPRSRAGGLDLMLGHGLTPRLSLYLGTALGLEPGLERGDGRLYLGGMSALVDSDHFDLDLILDGSLGSSGADFGPGFELNLDAAPELARFGLYWRVQLSAVERELFTTLGAYVTVADGHQLLFETLTEAADVIGGGGVAVGYNLAVGDSMEIINQVYVDVPEPGERLSFSITTGVIVAMTR